MKSDRHIRQSAKQIRIEPNSIVDQRVLERAESVLTTSQRQQTPDMSRCGSVRRTVMQKRIYRYSVVAAAAIMLLIPLSYGAIKAINYFIIYEDKVEYQENDGSQIVMTQSQVFGGGNVQSEEDAARIIEEFKELYQAGKAKEIKPGVWQVILSDGTPFNYGGNLENLFLSDSERQERFKAQSDEIRELRKAGKFEKTYKPEHDFEIGGISYRYFEAKYTLSDGRVVTSGDSEPAEK